MKKNGLIVENNYRYGGKRKALMLGAAFVALTFAPLGAAHAASDEEVAELKAQIQMLMEKVEQLEKANEMQAERQNKLETKVASGALPAPQYEPAENAVTGGEVPGSFKLPGTNTSVKIGGYVKTDVIYDVDNASRSGALQDLTRFAAIPLDGGADSNEQNFRFHAKQSRINLATYTPSEYGTVKTYIEGDFFNGEGTETFSNSSGFRLRHAYGEIGGFLAGQTWSNFMDMAAYPETIDFGATVGRTFIRQGQLRYTHDFSDTLDLALAIENPAADVSEDVGNSQQELDDLPDFTARLTKSGDFGSLSLRGMARQIQVRDVSSGDEEEEFGYGVGLSGKIKVGAKDDIRFDVKYGDGIGRYIFDVGLNGKAAAFDDTPGVLETQEAWGGYVGYRHWWTDVLRSNVYFGYVSQDNESFLDPDAVNEEVYSVHGNLLWDVTKKVRVGGEVIHGARETESGLEGDGTRLQFGAYYFF